MCSNEDATFCTTWELIVTTRRFQHRLEVAMDQALEHYGHSFAQYRVLEVLQGGRSMHISDLAQRLRVTRQAASFTVEKLRLGDLVDIEDDGYMRFVSINDRGHRRIGHCRRATDSIQKDLETALTAPERGRLTQLLGRAERFVTPPECSTWWLDR